MEGEVIVRLLNTLVLGGVLCVAWLLFEPVWKGVRNMMSQAEWDDQLKVKLPDSRAGMPEFHHVGIPLDCQGCESMVAKWRFTWLECTQVHWRTVVNRVQAVKGLPAVSGKVIIPPAQDLMTVGFRGHYNWSPKPEVEAEVFRVKKKYDIENVSDGKGDLS